MCFLELYFATHVRKEYPADLVWPLDQNPPACKKVIEAKAVTLPRLSLRPTPL
jgi:hypothetical protein